MNQLVTNEYFLIKDKLENARKLYRNILLKKKRVKQWLEYHKAIINILGKGYIYYATFTINNDHIKEDNKINEYSFIKYLKRNGVLAYKLFKDFCDTTNRIHYHGYIFMTKKITNYTLNLYGFTKMTIINGKLREEEERIINYITNYVIKNDYFKQKCLTRSYNGSIMDLVV